MSNVEIKTAGQIKNGFAYNLALLQSRQKLIEVLVRAVNYCGEMCRTGNKLTEKGKAGLCRINKILQHTDVYMLSRSQETAEDEAVAMLMSKWIYLCIYPNMSGAQFAAFAEGQVLLEDMVEAGDWFEHARKVEQHE